MLIIEERKPIKLPQKTSLFMKLPFYNVNVWETLIQSSNSFFDKKKNEFEFPINKLSWLVNYLTEFDDVKFISLEEEEKEHLDTKHIRFKVKPYRHQLEAVEYGLNHNGWLLLDSMGTGKTGTMIYLAEVLKKKENLSHCFIICGVNGLKYNWVREIEKFSNLDCTILGQKVSKRGKVSIGNVSERINHLKNGIKEFFVITNIETLQNEKFAEAFNKSKSKFDLLVLDEAHKLKCPTTKSAKTLLKLKANRCVALTGTVIMNNPEDAYVPLKWTNNCESTFSNFKGMFNVYGGFGGVQVIGHKNLDLLKEMIDACSLRRTLADVVELPPKTYITDYVELGTSQKQLYNEVEQGIAKELDLLDHKPTIMEELTINMRLRQITACPSMISTATSQSSKLDRMEELVEDIVAQGEKVVIFSTFKGTVGEICKRLNKYGVVSCTGDDDDSICNRNVQDFQSKDDIKVFVGTWQKCGTGFTLTSASYIIFIDTPWTDADFSQAADRIYRIGQKKPCFIITLITKDTYDERVQEILNHKEGLSGYIIDNKQIHDVNIFD